MRLVLKFSILRILLAVACAAIYLPALVAQGPEPPAPMLGAAWYPEQWPESRWNADLDLMQKAHMHLVRVAEFSWSRLEPEEGHYDLDWLERAINAAGEHGIYVVLGTPTCAPPVWLTEKYPETLRTTENGKRLEHSTRQAFNWSNPKYRELSREIVRKLAMRFGHNPYVIAWQIDNEYRSPSFDAGTRVLFQQWLRSQYGTLDHLNRRWSSDYWSQTYNSWEQIPIPDNNDNPGLRLKWNQFVSDTWGSYQKNQIDVIRQYAEPRQRITTNTMGWFDGYDHYVVSRDLDFSAWDDPIGERPFDPIRNGAAHDLTRGFKNKNFWVIETTAGPTGWASVNTMLEKGEMRALLWHDVGHGADAMSYWQWRDAFNGQEQNHGAIVDVNGEPMPLYQEMAQVGREFDKAAPLIRGTTVQSEVAILHSYNSRWVLNWQKLNRSHDPIAELLSYYRPLHHLGHSVDIVRPDENLAKYKLVVAPGLNLLTEEEAENLIGYVKAGGHLVLGQLSAMKDGDNSRWPQRQPGPLAELLGGAVEQYYAIKAPVPVPVTGTWGIGTADGSVEQLIAIAPDVKVLMRYGKSDGWLDGQPAAITRSVGSGSITYIGAALDDASMQRAARWMLKESRVGPELPAVPDGVEVYRRVGEERKIFIFENLGRRAQTVHLPHEMTNVLDGGKAVNLTLQQYGVAVMEEQTVTGSGGPITKDTGGIAGVGVRKTDDASRRPRPGQ